MRKLTKYHKQHLHNKAGIVRWLKKMNILHDAKGNLKKEEYERFLKDFCLSHNPEFDLTKAKGAKSLESYIQNNWRAFHKFTMKNKSQVTSG